MIGLNELKILSKQVGIDDTTLMKMLKFDKLKIEDDYKIVLDTLSKVFKKWGFKVEVFNSSMRFYSKKLGEFVIFKQGKWMNFLDGKIKSSKVEIFIKKVEKYFLDKMEKLLEIKVTPFFEVVRETAKKIKKQVALKLDLNKLFIRIPGIMKIRSNFNTTIILLNPKIDENVMSDILVAFKKFIKPLLSLNPIDKKPIIEVRTAKRGLGEFI